MNNNWKVLATEFLSSRSVNKSLLQSIYKKITGKNCSSDLLKSNIIEEILAKSSTPHDLLSKQEITAALLRSYLDIDPKDTVYSVQELHDMITEKWTASSAASAPSAPSIPLSQETNASTTSVGGSTSTSTSTKRKRDDSIQQEVRKQRVELNNWWKVTNCVTEKASCSGTTETGFVVTPSFPNCDVRTGSEINGEGNVVYILGNHSQDGDQIEDNFGPWPKKMSSLNAVHLQFRSLQSESITEFSNRLGMSVGGTRLDHLSSSMLLFNTLKLINAIEVKKTLRKAVEGLPGHDASSFPENLITLLETEHNVPPELIVAADRVDQLKTQLNEECLKVHTILYSKDKKQVLQSAIQRANSASAAGAPIVKDLSQTIYKNRLRSLDACEKRAERCREEAEIEKKAMEAAAKAGKEAEKRQQLEQIRAQVDALEVKISSRNKTLDRLRGNANSIDRNIIESTLQLREVRNRMAQSILTCGQYDHHQKTENDAISCSLIGLQETYQCIMDHIGVEEESLRKEVKQLSTLQAKLE